MGSNFREFRGFFFVQLYSSISRFNSKLHLLGLCGEKATVLVKQGFYNFFVICLAVHFWIWLKHPVHLSWGVTQDTRVRYNGLFRKWTRYDIAFYLSGLSHFYALCVDARNGDLSVQSNLMHTDPFGPNTSVSTVPFIEGLN